MSDDLHEKWREGDEGRCTSKPMVAWYSHFLVEGARMCKISVKAIYSKSYKKCHTQTNIQNSERIEDDWSRTHSQTSESWRSRGKRQTQRSSHLWIPWWLPTCQQATWSHNKSKRAVFLQVTCTKNQLEFDKGWPIGRDHHMQPRVFCTGKLKTLCLATC